MTRNEALLRYGAYGLDTLLREVRRPERQAGDCGTAAAVRVVQGPAKKTPPRKEEEPRTVACMRCGGTMNEDSAVRMYANYRLCPRCAGLHRGIAAYVERLRRYQESIRGG